MFLSILRFWYKGWIADLYINPQFFFGYTYLEWVKPLDGIGMYFIFAACALFALALAFGAFYRLSAIGFFLTFTYIELLDKTTYLNHYYFVSVMAFLMIFIPAHRRFSLDLKWKRVKAAYFTPKVFRYLIMFQLACVYFFAGLAKLNSDWLLYAQPMTIWLKAFGHWPVLGPVFDSQWLPYFFSWAGAIYDLSIPFLLLSNRTRPFAYLAVVFFHVMTRIMFPIGMFPYIMIVATLIFFPPKVHEIVLKKLGEKIDSVSSRIEIKSFQLYFIGVFVVFQLLLPFRHVLYPGELFWHEQGFRFSWRVMLIEKTGQAFFYVKGDGMKRPLEVQNRDFLTPIQEKMMATQPDMILQYAHFLRDHYAAEGIENPEVKAKVYVTLNGRPSQLFIDPDVNLAAEKSSWKRKNWILPLGDEIYGY